MRTGRVLVALGVLLSIAQPAAATCRPVTLGFRPSQLKPCDTGGPIPPNAILRLRKSGSLKGSDRLTFANDINARFPCSASEVAPDCVPVVRVREESLGTRLLSAQFTGCVTDLFVEGEPDTIAPPPPSIGEVSIGLVDRPDSCDVDALEIRIDNVLDERAPARLLQLALYVGATEEEARTRVQIDHLLEVYDATTSVTLFANLGRADGRERPLARGLLAAGPHCFAVETVDWAGNFSPRSAPLCLDHTNEADLHVRRVASTDTESCASSPRGPSSSWLFAALAIVAYRLRRKRR